MIQRQFYTGSNPEGKRIKDIKHQSARVRRQITSNEGVGLDEEELERMRREIMTMKRSEFSPSRRRERDGSPIRGRSALLSAHLRPSASVEDVMNMSSVEGSVSTALSASISSPQLHSNREGFCQEGMNDEGGGNDSSCNVNIFGSVSNAVEADSAWLASDQDHAKLEIDAHSGPISKLLIPKKTNLLLSASLDGTIKLWGQGGMACVAIFDSHRFSLASNVEAAPSSKKSAADLSSERAEKGGRIQHAWADELCESIWAGCLDGCLKVWGGSEGKPLRILKGHEGSITVMEGISASESSSAGLQSTSLVATGAKVYDFLFHRTISLSSTQFSDDGIQ